MNARHSARPASRRTGLSETLVPSRRLGPAALVLLAATILAALAIAPAVAAAAPPAAFWTRCAADNESDIACSGPRGVATAPASAGPGVAGHVFVADSFARRIDEFSPWGQFVKTWGQDVVQSGPDDAGSGFEICVPANGDVCKEGTTGSSAGQFGSPQGVAVDSAGDVYALDRGLPSNQRVQKFDPEGHFLRMWGGGVNSGTSGNPDLCTDAGPPTDVCKAGTEGTANGQFGELSVVGAYIAIDTLGTASAADDKVYVGDQERIQRFDTNGTYQSQIAIPGEKVRALAVDPAGNLYASFCGTSNCNGGEAAKANVRKLSPAGVELGTVAVANPQALATDAAGELFVADGTANPTIRQFSSAGSEVPGFAFKDGFSESTGIATGSACLGSGYDLYASNAQEPPKGYLRVYGPVPDEAHLALCPPPLHAPEIAGQATLVVQADRATVQGAINPKFWADTSYYVQYASAACIEGGGWEASCVSQEPAVPAQLGAGVIDSPAAAKVELTGLAPASEYAYRFVAESSGGGPVHGRGGSETEDGDVAFFTTSAIPTSPAADSCPNHDFRSGPAAALPDCRAYELVSPIDKNGGDIVRPGGEGYVQASLDGNRLTYNTAAAFGDQPSSKLINQYLATRQEGVGWQTHGINAPFDRLVSHPGEDITYAFREAIGFSPDLCNGWLADYNATPLKADAQPGYVNLYRQDLCGDGGLETLTTSEPAPGAKHLSYVTRYALEGLTADGAHAFFLATAGLTPEAVPGETNTQIYERSGGGLHLVSVLRSGAADPGLSNDGAVVGGGVKVGLPNGGNVEHAVSGDGSRVYWTSHAARFSAEGKLGKLYLRENPDRPQSALVDGGASGSGDLSLGGTTVTNANATFGEFAVGQGIAGKGIPPETTIIAVNPGESKLTLSAAASKSQTGVSLEAFSECSEAELACTVEVSAGEKATFWAATPDGSAALYSEGEFERPDTGAGEATLYRFDAESRTRSTLAEGVMGVLGTSEDLSRIYFVSTDALTGPQENGEGDKAQAGKPNLYLDEEGTLSFVATLLRGAGGDIFGEVGDGAIYNLASFNPLYRPVRVTSDGSHLLFESRAQLTGYDNTDALSGKADIEVFAYEAGGDLSCVSCNPSGARPRGSRLTPGPYGQGGNSTEVWSAAWIPTTEDPLHASHVLSENGRRLFFLSRDGWLPADTNGVQDVYEWEAPGEGGCTKESTAFHKANGGCVYLISSGESPEAAEFWEASADGRDVFFTTGSSLLPQDPGHADVYDARAGGGFPQPVPPPQCEGENCQSAPPPPVDPTLSSASFKGAGNPKKASKPRCAKNKRQVRKAGKTRCVAKHKHKRNAAHKRNADRNRRTAR